MHCIFSLGCCSFGDWWTNKATWCQIEIKPSCLRFSFFMPPPLGAGGIMFSGCPSVRPSVRSKPEIASFHLYMGPLVNPTNRDRFTACLSVRPSVRRGFRAFAGERMEGLACNFACWCIVTMFRTEQIMVTVCLFSSFWCHFDLVKRVKFGGFRAFPWERMEGMGWNFVC